MFRRTASQDTKTPHRHNQRPSLAALKKPKSTREETERQTLSQFSKEVEDKAIVW